MANENPTGPISQTRRRWHQFRLKSLLVWITLCAIVFGVVAAPIVRLRRGRAQVAALWAQGVDLEFDYQFDAEGNRLEETPPPEPTTLEAWFGVNEFPRIVRIGMHETWSDVNLALLRIGPQLAEIDHSFGLNFRDTELSATGLASIAGLRQLTFLDLGGTSLDDDQLQPLAKMTNLRELTLPATTGDAGLAHVAGLTRLRRLARSRPDRSNEMRAPGPADFERIKEGQWLTDAGLAHLAALSELESLELGFAKVSDAGLARLAALAKLEALDLSHTDITDAGLAQLKPLKHLKRLDLSDTRVLGDGILELAAMPELRCLDLACCQSPLDFEDLRKRRGDAACETERRAAVNGAIASLANLKQVETLFLAGIDLYDESCEFLTQLPHLKKLDLSRSSLTSAGIEYLKSAPQLQELWLADTDVDNLAVKTLKSFAKLKSLHVGVAEIDTGRFEGSRIKADNESWPDLPPEW